MLRRAALLHRLPAGKLIDILATLEEPPAILTASDRRIVLACRSYLRMAEKVNPQHPVLIAFADLLVARGVLTAAEHSAFTAESV
ncbi:MAG: hypothetical protein ACREVR_02625 [Burkholderiales bacterium]